MNEFVEAINAKGRTKEKFNFIPYVDGDSVLIELNKTMSDAIFQTIVFQTINSGKSIDKNNLYKLATAVDVMLHSEITILIDGWEVNCHDLSPKPLENVDCVYDVFRNRYSMLKDIYDAIVKTEFKFGDMRITDNKIWICDEHMTFECKPDERRLRHRLAELAEADNF